MSISASPHLCKTPWFLWEEGSASREMCGPGVWRNDMSGSCPFRCPSLWQQQTFFFRRETECCGWGQALLLARTASREGANDLTGGVTDFLILYHIRSSKEIHSYPLCTQPTVRWLWRAHMALALHRLTQRTRQTHQAKIFDQILNFVVYMTGFPGNRAFSAGCEYIWGPCIHRIPRESDVKLSWL